MDRGDAAPAAPPASPLVAERVIDASQSVAGAFCAKLLGDLGADVIKIERPGAGDPTRHPAPGSASDDAEASPAFLYFNTSKRGLAVDLTSDEGIAIFRRLVGSHDVVIADGPEPDLAALGIGYADLVETNESIVMTTISPFGSAGPYADYASTHLVGCALAGWAAACGTVDREPLQTGGELIETIAGAYAAVATLAAIEGRARHGGGDHVDVSSWEAAITCAMGPTLYWEYWGDLPPRKRSDHMTGPSYNVRCRDGYVGVNVLTEAQWETLCVFAGLTDLADDPKFDHHTHRAPYVDEIRALVDDAIKDRKADEVFQEAQLWRLPFGLVVSPNDVLDLPIHAERGYLVEQVQPGLGAIRTPRVPFVMSRTPSAPGRAPQLGEHTAEVLAGVLGLTPEAIADLEREGVIA